MEITLSDKGITLKVGDILKAIQNSEQKELLELKYALQKISNRTFTKEKSYFKKTEKKKKCKFKPCSSLFLPDGNAQKFCSIDCCRKWHKAKKLKQKKDCSELVDNPKKDVYSKKATKTTSPILQATKSVPTHIPGKVTGRNYRLAEDNAFV